MWVFALTGMVAFAEIHPSVDVLTQHNDKYRTGWNSSETFLNPDSVASGRFHLQRSFPVDGQVYAQPLVVANYTPLLQSGGRSIVRDLLIVGTAHNTLYCFDTAKSSSQPVWTAKLGKSVPNQNVQCDDMRPEIGIVSTPVIDRDARTVYVVNKCRVPVTSGAHRQVVRLHALDLDTGNEMAGSPVDLAGSVAGTAPDAVNGQVPFDPSKQMNRPGLLLDRGVLYIACGGHCDNGPFHGWIFAYHARKLAKLGLYCTTPDGDVNAGIPSGAGGIWMAGNGLACDDDGSIYFSTGNGAYSLDSSGRQTGNSLAKVRLGENGFQLQTFFTPHDTQAMNERDRDLGSAGVLVVPSSTLLVGGGKDKDLYVADRSNFGGFSPSADAILQRWPGTNDGLWTAPIYWNSGLLGPQVFFGGKEDYVKSFSVAAGLLTMTPTTQSQVKGKWPGSAMSGSSDGDKEGIVWTLSQAQGKGILRAYEANNLANLLWHSDIVASDAVGVYAKFCPPTVANGKVFVPTFSNKVNVYGLNP